MAVKSMYINHGALLGRVVLMSDEHATTAEGDGWAVPYAPEGNHAFEAPPRAEFEDGIPPQSFVDWSLTSAGYEELVEPPEVVDPVAPTVTAVTPNTSPYGAPDVAVTVNGTGFTPASTILADGGTTPTVFVTESQLTTTIATSTAVAEAVIAIAVREGELDSNTVDFTLTLPVGRSAEDEDDEDEPEAKSKGRDAGAKAAHDSRRR
jgi:hypothetical protein